MTPRLSLARWIVRQPIPASLASRLLHGLETPIYEVSDEEVFGRMREAEEDPSVLITFHELVAGLKHRGS